jgi:selenocysteine-specific elongation factor
MEAEEIVNVNIGVLGHVDSGKTSFCAAISTVLSTAALDKSPQSQERGITQDLQFSAFRVLKASSSSETSSQIATSSSTTDSSNPDPSSKKTIFNFALVDCPGHASLIRTIIGGMYLGLLPIFALEILHFLIFLLFDLVLTYPIIFPRLQHNRHGNLGD